MSMLVKFLIGLSAVLVMAWISHGPMGRGEAFIDDLEMRAQRRIRAAGLPGIQVRIQREPLAREAILSGQADEFQREGLGSYPGLNDRMRALPGVGRVRWEGES